jgi:hypothetical protein
LSHWKSLGSNGSATYFSESLTTSSWISLSLLRLLSSSHSELGDLCSLFGGLLRL